jgi:hypothetical protein
MPRDAFPDDPHAAQRLGRVAVRTPMSVRSPPVTRPAPAPWCAAAVPNGSAATRR